MAKFELFRRDSGEIMAGIVLLFVCMGSYVFWLSYDLIKMGVKGEFQILSTFKGWQLYIASLSPGIFLAIAIVVIFTVSLPRVLHSKG